jgi:hypothetical protein
MLAASVSAGGSLHEGELFDLLDALHVEDGEEAVGQRLHIVLCRGPKRGKKGDKVSFVQGLDEPAARGAPAVAGQIRLAIGQGIKVGIEVHFAAV